jgi:peptidyl-prolyl cis-trans isomerase SurA
MKTIITVCTLLVSIAGFSQTDTSAAHKAASKAKAKSHLEDIRKEILDGERDFASAANMYSMDPSYSQGGLYKNIKKGTFTPEFDAVAFTIKVGEVSQVFETKWGYNILVVDAKRGDVIDVRQILIMPK